MSLLPYLFDDYDVARPSRHWRWLDDWKQPLVPRSFWSDFPSFFKNLNAALQDNGAQVTYDKDKFQANFDVQHFKPNEISVKVKNNMIEIEGKHEEKQDEHGQIYRHFVRKYTLPNDCDVNKVETKLSSDGVLSVCAPRKGTPAIEERSIPVIHTGQPAKSKM